SSNDSRRSPPHLPYSFAEPTVIQQSAYSNQTMHTSPKLDLSNNSDTGFAGDHSLMMAANGAVGFPNPTIPNGTHSPSTDSSSRDSMSVDGPPPPPPNHTSPTTGPPPNQPPMHLGMALSHAGLEPHFPGFNGNDIFFQNNGL
ncbi:hypothetical protein PFISCL1PPCAC_5350, partial [Pristionchus fissidentatus]